MSENIPIEELIKKVTDKNESYDKLKSYFPDLDFTEELEKDPALWEYLRKSINAHAPAIQPPLNDPNAPELNDDFSNYFVINNLPITEEAKVQSLKEKIVNKVLGKRDL